MCIDRGDTRRNNAWSWMFRLQQKVTGEDLTPLNDIRGPSQSTIQRPRRCRAEVSRHSFTEAVIRSYQSTGGLGWSLGLSAANRMLLVFGNRKMWLMQSQKSRGWARMREFLNLSPHVLLRNLHRVRHPDTSLRNAVRTTFFSVGWRLISLPQITSDQHRRGNRS